MSLSDRKVSVAGLGEGKCLLSRLGTIPGSIDDSMKPNRYLALILVAAAIGFLFASVSTRDFAMHLDREVHDVTCSFTPGLSDPETGDSGCLVTMISPYSSVLRSLVWGGIPIALPGMAIFAFLFAFAAEMVISKRQDHRRAAGLMALATAVPLVTSLVMATISLFELDAVCKLCVGIYVSSLLCFVGGLGLYLRARKGTNAPSMPRTPKAKASKAQDDGQEPAFVSESGSESKDEPEIEDEPHEDMVHAQASLPGLYIAGVLAAALLFVAIPTGGYFMAAPDHSRFIGTCGSLTKPADSDLLIPLGPSGGVPVLEILDPLCPACRQFEQRIEDSGFAEDISRSAILFPLDDTCNWMVDKAMHPGACTVSRAILCAGSGAEDVLAWAFEKQESIMAAAKDDPVAAHSLVSKRFPHLAACMDSPEIEAKLNRSLRWAVSNKIRVLTPQLFVGDVRLCNEDVDIGLGFALSHMIERHRAGTLRAVDSENPELDGVLPTQEAAEPGALSGSEKSTGTAPAATEPPTEPPAGAPTEPPTGAPTEPPTGAPAEAAIAEGTDAGSSGETKTEPAPADPPETEEPAPSAEPKSEEPAADPEPTAEEAASPPTEETP